MMNERLFNFNVKTCAYGVVTTKHQCQEHGRSHFSVLGLERKSDRLSFRFHNLAGNRPTDTTTYPHTAGYARPVALVSHPIASRQLIEAHHVLRPRRVEDQPSGRASPGLPSDTGCTERFARLLAVGYPQE